MRAKLSPELRDLLADTLPHKITVALFWLAGWNPDQIANEISPLHVSDAFVRAEQTMRADERCSTSEALGWCAIVGKNLDRRIEDFLHADNRWERKRLRSIVKVKSVDTLVCAYGDDDLAEDVAWWCAEVVELNEIARTRAGDAAAFAQLRARYERAMETAIRTTDHGRENLADVTRKLWCVARQELSGFKPALEIFGEFLRYWADLLCLDSDAFERFQKSYSVLVRAIIWKRVFDSSKREDVAQDAWLLIWKYLPRFEPERANFRRFVIFWTKIAIRRAIPPVSGGEPEPEDEDLPDDGAGMGIDGPALGNPIQIDPRPEPSELAALREELEKSLRAAFSDGDAPHQNIAFGFNIPLNWKPQAIARELWYERLESLVNRLCRELQAVYKLGETDLEQWLAPLCQALADHRLQNESFDTFAREAEIRLFAERTFTRKEDEKWRKKKSRQGMSNVEARDDILRAWRQLPDKKVEKLMDDARAQKICHWVGTVVKRLRKTRAAMKPKTAANISDGDM